MSRDCKQRKEAFISFWIPEEAAAKEYKQIGVSSCGATAVLNVLVSGFAVCKSNAMVETYQLSLVCV